MAKKSKTEKTTKQEKTGKNLNQAKKRNQINSVLSHLKDVLYSRKSDINRKEHILKAYSDYITETFNSTIIHMFIVYLMKNKENLKKYKYDEEPNFINKFVILIKELHLNEIEVAFLTLLLDKVGWKLDNYEHWMYFYCLGIYSKKKVTGEYESDELLKKHEFAEEKYLEFVNGTEYDKIDTEGISNKELNERFMELTKPINSYCRKNFINYSGIADKIIRLSQPYGEESNGNKLLEENNVEETINNNEGKKMEDYETFKANYNISNINNNNIDINRINNLGSLNPYIGRNSINSYLPGQFGSIRNDLNLLSNRSHLSLHKGSSNNSLGSGGGNSFRNL